MEDREAFTEIYDRYMGVLYLHALKMVKDEHEAEDIVHELFISLWLNAAEVTINITLSAYLYRAIKNKIFNIFAHQKIKLTHLESLQEYINAGNWQTDELMRARELSFQIEKEVSSMPAKMREVFELSRNAGLSYKEIAERLNISDKTVKKQINNALKILRLKINLFLTLLF
ncbi:MAG: polymerase subunit sigma-70 [Mucilaginibacter sp.]|nr:polymerase subunit sigma-70 [Mucilaginibacter sp.]